MPNFNNAKMLNTTATTLSVKGNGKTLGLNDGSRNLGLANSRGGDNWTSTIARTSYYNTNVGTSAGNTQSTDNQKTLGITTDSTKSGIVANMPDTTKPTLWIIKY